MAALNQKCCKVSTNGVYTCVNDNLVEEDLRWEAFQYQGYEAKNYQCSYVPQIRQYWNVAQVQLKDTTDIKTILQGKTYNEAQWNALILKLTQVYCNSLLSLTTGGVDRTNKIYNKLAMIDEYYDTYNAFTWWTNFSLILDTCYDKNKKDADKITAANKIIEDWDPFIFYGWTDSVLGKGKGKLIEAEVKLVEQYEGKNMRKKYEKRLIDAFVKRETNPTPARTDNKK